MCTYTYISVRKYALNFLTTYYINTCVDQQIFVRMKWLPQYQYNHVQIWLVHFLFQQSQSATPCFSPLKESMGKNTHDILNFFSLSRKMHTSVKKKNITGRIRDSHSNQYYESFINQFKIYWSESALVIIGIIDRLNHSIAGYLVITFWPFKTS